MFSVYPRMFIELTRVTAATLLLLTATLVAEGQPVGKTYRIGFLSLTPGENATLMKALLERLEELGYSEGKNMAFEYRSAEGRSEQLPQLAMELVRARPDVLIAGFGTLTAQAAKAATTTIPIVFTNLGDPVGAGLVTSLGRPGGNVTGLTDQARDLQGKRLQLLQDVIPGKPVIAVLMNPDTPFTALAVRDVRAAAETAHIRVDVLEARTADEVSLKMLAASKAGAGGLLVLEDPLTFSVRQQIADLAAKLRLPAVYGYRDFAESGGLMS